MNLQPVKKILKTDTYKDVSDFIESMFVNVYPEAIASAYRKGELLEYITWLILKKADSLSFKKGDYSTEKIIKGVARAVCCLKSYDAQKRLFTNGIDRYWTDAFSYEDNRCVLKSNQKVYGYLGSISTPTRPFIISVKRLIQCNSYREVELYLLHLIFVKRQGGVVPKSVVAKELGLTVSAIDKLIETLKPYIKIKKNFVVVSEDIAAINKFQDMFQKDKSLRLMFLHGKRVRAIMRQVGNSYYSLEKPDRVEFKYRPKELSSFDHDIQDKTKIHKKYYFEYKSYKKKRSYGNKIYCLLVQSSKKNNFWCYQNLDNFLPEKNQELWKHSDIYYTHFNVQNYF